jgi:hypothetical protein
LILFKLFLLGRIRVFQHLEELLKTLSNSLANKLPSLRIERNVLSLLRRVVAANTGFYSIAVRYLLQENSPCSRSLPVRDTEHAAVVPENLCLVGDYLRQNSCSVVIGLPDIVLRTIDEDILSNRVSVKI